MAVAQLVVALSFLALSSGNKDTKTGSPSRRLFISTGAQNATDQQREGNEQKHTRFLRWALNSPTEEFTSVPFSPETEHENQRSPWGHAIRRRAAMMLNKPPPLDKIDGRYVTRELVEPDFEGPDSFRGEAVVNRKFALQPESEHSHRALKQFRTKRSDLEVISGMNDDVRLVKRLNDIDREWLSNRKIKKAGFSFSEKIPGSGFVSWEKKNLDDSDQYGYSNLNKRNFDEINRAGFHSLGRRNFDQTNRAGLHNLGRRNFDEIDRAGFHTLGRRNFDEIDRAGFHSLGRRNFDEIDRSGFHSLGRRNFDEIDKSAFRGFGKRDFDEIDRSGFRSFGKRDFDEIDRSGFRSFGKRDFDEIDRSGFRSFGKRDFDEIDRSGFRSFGKRDFDEIDRSGFRSFGKRDFDEIDRSGFRELGKRSLKRSASFGESSKESYEGYKVENDESRKRNFDKGDQAAFRNFSERSATGEISKPSA